MISHMRLKLALGNMQMETHDQPEALSLSAMIFQYFMELLPFSLPDEFPTPRNLSGCFSGLNDRQAHGQCHKALCPSPAPALWRMPAQQQIPINPTPCVSRAVFTKLRARGKELKNAI
jgi:hypothetical protein